jgi:hypothetical protein
MDSQAWVAWFPDHVNVMVILGILKRISPLDSVLVRILPKKFRESGRQFEGIHSTKITKRLEWDTNRLDL